MDKVVYPVLPFVKANVSDDDIWEITRSLDMSRSWAMYNQKFNSDLNGMLAWLGLVYDVYECMEVKPDYEVQS